MALDKASLCLRIAAIGLMAPALCLPAAISINGVCKSGDCSHPGTLFYPDGNMKPFFFTYTFLNTDTYSVHGSYSASNTSEGTSIVFTVVASYLGNLRNTSSADDTLNIDLLQDYSVESSPDGTYSYSSSATLGPTFGGGSYFQTNLSYDGQNVGQIGPYSGVGYHEGSSSATLTGLTNPLSADFRYTFFFASGSLPTRNVTESVSAPPTAGSVGSGGSNSRLNRETRRNSQ